VIKVVIAGAAGRMGKMLVTCAGKVRDIRIVAALENAGHEAIGRDAGVVAGLPALGVPITADVKAALSGADVLIDFTLHTAVPENAETAALLGKAMVIGATGLDAAETERVEKAAAKIPIVWSPNMSLGVNLLFAMVRKAASDRKSVV
jgi:4-hydroxy-tetrahydrodipicolinate reductase